MIKIAHLITGLDTGGAETMLSRLALNMDRSRFQNIILSMDSAETPIKQMLASHGAPVISLSVRNRRKALAGVWRLVKTLRRKRPDIVQTWLHHADLLGLITTKCVIKAPVLWNLRCAELRPRDASKSLFMILPLLARLSRYTDAVIVNSAAGKRAHEALGYRPNRWEIIPNGFDTDEFRPSKNARDKIRHSLGLSDSRRIVGLVARYHPMKDHETFIRAAGALCRKRDDTHFVLLGTGVDRTNAGLMAMIERERVGDRVHLLGERRDVGDITASFDVATCSSYSEGFPNVVGEAMACGVPCVVTDVGDSADVVGETGFVVPLKNPEDMADAWDRLLSLGESERKKLGDAARRRVSERYSMEAVMARYERLYESIITKEQSPS